ncbi:hypothetical protein PVAND_014679 [Polypedilum vanderplanki]|uniref:Copper homeostasis protein cutC homolog n=1 Tax=Polypedilum vanderplanki TaxID=319348 RepID=A0A9J6BAQ5_POLVA|nr:hypothetical protein PVAND_014679 [Polypedilum vanderplanki]
MIKLEVCVDSLESVQYAVLGGADRIELCSSLSEAGLTPSLGLFEGAKRITENTKTKLFVMIRIRGGNFNYSQEEIEAMIEDVKYFKSHNADGIVFGALDESFEIDEESCRKLLQIWGHEKPATFHRAFDETKIEKIDDNVRKIASLGFTRILTSGFESTAEKGIENLKLIKKVADEVNLLILPGSGVNKNNAKLIIDQTNCKEIHGSARSERNIQTKLSLGGEKIYVCERIKVEEILRILNT